MRDFETGVRAPPPADPPESDDDMDNDTPGDGFEQVYPDQPGGIPRVGWRGV